MALAHCHGQGVTHRNLKPKYVLLQPRGRLVGEALRLQLGPLARVRVGVRVRVRVRP
jgi:hypothetical protein